MSILKREKIELINKTLIYKLIEYLIILLPVSLVFSKFFSELITILILILFIFITIYENKINIFYNKYFLFFLLWCSYLIIISVTSSNYLLSLESTLFFFRFGLLSLCIYYICLNNKKFIFFFFKVLFSLFIVLFIDSLIQYYFEKNIFGYPYTNNRVSSFFSDEKILGSFICLFLPISLLITYYLKNENKYYLIYLILFIACILILLSNERTAFINYIFISGIFLFCISNNLKKFIFVIMTFIILIIITLYSNTNLKERIIDLTFKQIRTIDSINNNQDLKNFNFVPSVYKHYYNSSFNMFLDNKYFGIGPKNFRYMCKDDKYFHVRGCSTHPHHRFLQIFTETGLIGATPFILIFIYSMYRLTFIFINKNKYTINYYFFLLYFFIYMNPLLPSGNFFGSNINLIFFINLGLLFYINKAFKNDSN